MFLKSVRRSHLAAIKEAEYCVVSVFATSDRPGGSVKQLKRKGELAGVKLEGIREAGLNINSQGRARVLAVKSGEEVFAWDIDCVNVDSVICQLNGSKSIICYDYKTLHSFTGIKPGNVVDMQYAVRVARPDLMSVAQQRAAATDPALQELISAKGVDSLDCVHYILTGGALELDPGSAAWILPELNSEHALRSLSCVNAIERMYFELEPDLVWVDVGGGAQALTAVSDMQANGITYNRVESIARRSVLYNDIKTMSDSVGELLNVPARMLSQVTSGIPADVRGVIIEGAEGLGYELKGLSEGDFITSGVIKVKEFQDLLGLFKSKRLYSELADLEHRSIGDERVRSTFAVNLATMRMSSRSPNLQATSAPVRQLYTASAGNTLVYADYSQIELRVAAALAARARSGAGLKSIKTGVDHNKTMLRSVREGVDLHLVTALSHLGYEDPVTTLKADKDGVFGVKYAEERKAAKAVNFGLIYGMSAESLYRVGLVDYGLTWSLADAAAWRESFFDIYQDIRHLHAYTKNELFTERASTYKRARGGKYELSTSNIYKTKTLAGRVIWADSYTKALNYPAQGTGADIILKALSLLYKTNGYQTTFKLVNAVHDELVIECAERDAAHVAKLLTAKMLEAANFYLQDFDVPAEVNCKISKNWE